MKEGYFGNQKDHPSLKVVDERYIIYFLLAGAGILICAKACADLAVINVGPRRQCPVLHSG